MVAELLFLSPHLPHRRIAHAGGRFSWAWLTALSACSRVHLLTPASPENVSAPRDLPPCVKVTMLPLGPPPRLWAARFHDARIGGITPGIASLDAFRSSPAFAEAVASADLVEIHWQHLLPLANDVRNLRAGLPITAFVHDVMTQMAQREANSARHFKTRLASTVRAHRARVVEPRLLAEVDQIFTFTHKDRNLLVRMGVTRPVEVVDPNVQVPERPASGSERPVVAFTGAMSRSTNAESIAWFLAHVWPRVLSEMAGATLIVAGANPPKWLWQQRSSSVVVTGYVDDFDEIYRSASLFVAPLTLGAGIKFKVLDAMAYGLAVVATPIAADGIVEEAGSGCFAAITADPCQMAERIVFSLRHPDYRSAVGDRARSWVHSRFDFERSVSRALQVYQGLCSAPTGSEGPLASRDRS
jgi:glycosyltransferase involved in cell wall biosynthesis